MGDIVQYENTRHQYVQGEIVCKNDGKNPKQAYAFHTEAGFVAILPKDAEAKKLKFIRTAAAEVTPEQHFMTDDNPDVMSDYVKSRRRKRNVAPRKGQAGSTNGIDRRR